MGKHHWKINGIEYTDHTLNPVYALNKENGKRGHFCEKPDAEGTCRACYAEGLNIRLFNGLAYDKSNRDKVEWHIDRAKLDHLLVLNETKPESFKNFGNPRMVFLHNMIDLFQPSITNDLRNELFDVYDQCENLVLQIQTTYPWKMEQYLNNRYQGNHLPRQFWVGMSAGNQEWLERYCGSLLSIKAAVRYLIFEPLCGPVTTTIEEQIAVGLNKGQNYLTGEEWQSSSIFGGGENFLGEKENYREPRIHWVICGGESGNGTRVKDKGGNEITLPPRPLHPDWVRGLRDECAAAGVPFLFKQFGEWGEAERWEHVPGRPQMVRAGDCVVTPDGRTSMIRSEDLGCDLEGQGIAMRRLGKKKAGCLLDGKEYKEFPQV